MDILTLPPEQQIDPMLPPQVEKKDECCVPEQEKKSVALWLAKIADAEKKFDADFKRIKEDMEFAGGIQWNGQKDLLDERVIVNITLRNISQKVATLYAKNPTVKAQRRTRMDFQIWDETKEMLLDAAMRVQANPQDMEALAIINDYRSGKEWRALLDKISKTLEIVYKWQMDNQTPEYKTQVKSLVRRVITCGVGYCRLNFVRSFEGLIASSETSSTIQNRLEQVKLLQQKLESGEVDADSAEAASMQQLIDSVHASVGNGEMQEIQERLVFDFPPTTSIIVDPGCRNLKGFVNAQWIAQKYILPLSDVNAFFETEIKTGSDGAKEYREDGELGIGANEDGSKAEPRVCLYEVFSLVTKSHFFICDGHKAYVQAPEPVTPCHKGFWPIFALVFNEVEVEPGQKISIYPPSDVRLMMSAQKEFNRAREGLREHRKANAPKYMTGKGWLTDNDKSAINGSVPNQIIEIEGAPANADVNKLLVPFQHAQIDPSMYSTNESMMDVQLVTGSQESNLGPVSQGTATAATISEQSRMTVSGSNVDDLDDFLSAMAEAGGEMLFRELSEETVKRIAGEGAVWPGVQTSREEFLNQIYLQVQAASSGRPNKAIEIANIERLAPLLMQAGVNMDFLVREIIRRLDEQIDMSEAFPLQPPQQGSLGGSSPVPQKSLAPSQPLQMVGNGMAMPLAGHKPQ